jgi:hypothetical protein
MRRFLPIGAAMLLGTTGCAAASSPSGPDAFAGAYPLVSPQPSPGESTPTWTPRGKPLGPLRPYAGKGSKVQGTVVDKTAGLSYAKLGAPWKPKKGIGPHTGGLEYNVEKPKFAWLAGAYSAPMDSKYSAPVKAAGANGLRAAAELSAADVTFGDDDTLTPFAGQPRTVGGRKAWVAGYREHIKNPYNGIAERTVIMIAVDTGRSVPGILEISIAKPAYRLLPDITALIKSLKIVR